MILPVPVLKGTGDEALTFVDLGGHDSFFDDLSGCFPRPRIAGGAAMARTTRSRWACWPSTRSATTWPRTSPRSPTSTGSTPASDCPRRPGRRCPTTTTSASPCSNSGPARRMQRVHPIAYRYPADRPERVVLPHGPRPRRGRGRARGPLRPRTLRPGGLAGHGPGLGLGRGLAPARPGEGPGPLARAGRPGRPLAACEAARGLSQCGRRGLGGRGQHAGRGLARRTGRISTPGWDGRSSRPAGGAAMAVDIEAQAERNPARPLDREPPG